MVKSLKSVGQILLARVKEKPQFYMHIIDLIAELESVECSKKYKREPNNAKALTAAGSLRAILQNEQKKFDEETAAVYREGMPRLAYNRALKQFAESSIKAIHAHQVDLIAAPGLWNNLKAWVNNIIEEYLHIQNALGPVKLNTIAQGANFFSTLEIAKVTGNEDIGTIRAAPISMI